jgi:hypothetical protein
METGTFNIDEAEAAIATAIREATPEKLFELPHIGTLRNQGYNQAIDEYTASLTARLGIDTDKETTK